MTSDTSTTRAGNEAAPSRPVNPPSGQAGDRMIELIDGAAAAFEDFRRGRPDGMPRLVRLVTPLLWHTARQCGLSAVEAEDSVQQTFLTLVRRADSISDPLAVIRWLTVTLRRQAWRDRAAGQRRSSVEPTDALFPPEPPAEVAVMISDEQRRLWAHVAQLPERCRRLLAVIAFAPRPDYLTVARDLGMPVGSIGPTRGRCLDKLRVKLQGEEWG